MLHHQQIFNFVTVLNKSDFWKSQITQLYLIDEEWILIPRVGEHKIHFGTLTKINEKLDNNEPLDRAGLERIFKTAKEKTNKIKEDAGLVGTVVHGLIEDFLKGKDIPKQSDPAVVNCWNLFLDWWNKQEYEVVELEKKIYSKKYNYAGTLDLVVKDKKGNLVLMDIKTSNFISFDYFLQLNAYKFAYEEETGSKVSKSFIVKLSKKDAEIEIKEIPLNKKLFNAFIGAKYVMEQMQSVEI